MTAARSAVIESTRYCGRLVVDPFPLLLPPPLLLPEEPLLGPRPVWPEPLVEAPPRALPWPDAPWPLRPPAPTLSRVLEPTTTSMGRLTLNVLLSFAQFERKVTSERIRDKIAASKRKGLWVGGIAPLGYETKDRKIVVVEEEAEAGSDHLPAVFGAWQSQPVDGRPSRAGDRHQGAISQDWAHGWRHPIHPRPARPSSAQSVLHRRGRL